MLRHPSSLPPEELIAQCDVLRTRGSGPGGRHRNSTDSRVELRHRETGVVGAAGERRDQHRNREVALERLRLALAVQVRTPPGPVPIALWRSRIKGGRIVCSPRHPDYPALLAEALDWLASVDWEPGRAAPLLGCTPTQLVRFLASHGAAFGVVNAARAASGLHPLRS